MYLRKIIVIRNCDSVITRRISLKLKLLHFADIYITFVLFPVISSKKTAQFHVNSENIIKISSKTIEHEVN